jgi:hypothetical protein
MSTQFTAKKHQTAVLAAKETEDALARVPGEASQATQADLGATVHAATERRERVEHGLEAATEAKLEARAAHVSLKFAIAALVAYANATGEAALADVGAGPVSTTDLSVAEMLIEQLRQLKGPMPQALAAFVGDQIKRCREADAAAAKTQELASKADLAWSTEYFKLISLTSLGISLQQAAGFEVARKKSPPRGKAKKNVTPVVAPENVDPKPAA